MDDAIEMLTADAIQTAIKAERENIRLKRLLLAVIIGFLMLLRFRDEWGID